MGSRLLRRPSHHLVRGFVSARPCSLQNTAAAPVWDRGAGCRAGNGIPVDPVAQARETGTLLWQTRFRFVGVTSAVAQRWRARVQKEIGRRGMGKLQASPPGGALAGPPRGGALVLVPSSGFGGKTWVESEGSRCPSQSLETARTCYFLGLPCTPVYEAFLVGRTGIPVAGRLSVSFSPTDSRRRGAAPSGKAPPGLKISFTWSPELSGTGARSPRGPH